jgi:hypothetical protein
VNAHTIDFKQTSQYKSIAPRQQIQTTLLPKVCRLLATKHPMLNPNLTQISHLVVLHVGHWLHAL